MEKRKTTPKNSIGFKAGYRCKTKKKKRDWKRTRGCRYKQRGKINDSFEDGKNILEREAERR